MFHALKSYVRSLGGNGFTRPASRFACALLLALLLPVVAAAYTVVLRSGRRIEIPSNFTVTPLTLTYETAPGINVTLLMSTIDIAATERANNEPLGSLLRRVEKKPSAESISATPARRERKELTQSDIEQARLKRQQSEAAYERRRKELGLPSIEESRQRTEEETKRLNEESLQSQAEDSQQEAYWRSRATALRTDIAAIDAELAYLRQQLAEMPDYSSLGSYGFVSGFSPVFPLLRATTTFPTVTGNPGFMRGVNGTFGQTAGFLAFGGTPQVQVQLNAGVRHGNFGRHFGGVRRMGFPIVLGVPSANYDYSSEFNNLISRLHELEAARAGLQARWRLLEEEARRAGAQPGWLRP